MSVVLIAAMMGLFALPSDEVWNPAGRVLAPDGKGGDVFGGSVLVEGPLLLVGACGDTTFPYKPQSGSVRVFQLHGLDWSYVETITPMVPMAHENFGGPIAMSGSTLVVGAQTRDVVADQSGAVHVFEHTGNGWTQRAMLLPNQGGENDYFGFAVAIEGDVVVASSHGHDHNGIKLGYACIFERINDQWVRSVTFEEEPGAESNFGIGVAVMDVRVFVTAPGSAPNGSVSVFEKQGGVWVRAARLTPSDVTPSDSFGEAVAASDGRLFVGAIGDPQGQFSGSVHVFELVDGVWERTARLVATDSAEQQLFGASLAAHGDTLLVGSRRVRCGWQNTTHVYRLEAGQWVPNQILAAWGPSGDAYGPSLAFDGHTILSGDDGDRVGNAYTGSAFVFSPLAPAPCLGDMNHDGSLDVFDVIDFVRLHRLQECAADLNDDGRFDIFDFLTLQNSFANGCPE